MKKVVILGGSFDPVHNGHIDILKVAINELNCDEGWLMLAPSPRWKYKYSSLNFRLRLLSYVEKYESNIKVCKDELELKGTTYTYNTFLKLKEKYQDFEFYFLLGADQLDKLHLWYEIGELSKLVQLVVVNRPNYTLNKENIDKYNCKLINYTGPNISSTDFKDTLNLDLVPNYLHEYLIKDGNYYKRKLKKMMNIKRYTHSLSVAKVAKDIAKANKFDENKAFLAALLHDCAKDIRKDIEMELMSKHFEKYLNEKELVYHQFIGTILLKEEFNIYDEEIIEAVKWHTTGNENMSTLAKIVYASDKIDPSRGYDSSYMINACLKNIDEGFELVLRENYKFLLNKGLDLDKSELTKKCLEYYKIV